MDGRVCRHNPPDLPGRTRLRRQRQAVRAEPKPHLTHGSQFRETVKHRANRSSDRFIGMNAHFTIVIAPDKADRQAAPQLAALRFVSNAAIESCTNNVQFRFTHGALEPKNQSIIEQGSAEGGSFAYTKILPRKQEAAGLRWLNAVSQAWSRSPVGQATRSPAH
jgi:hypothetical protein